MSTNLDAQVSVAESQTSSVDPETEDDELDEEDELVDYTYDDDVEDTQPVDPEWYDFTCLDKDGAWSLLTQEVCLLSQRINVDIPIARSFLHHCNWQSDIVIHRFQEDKNKLFVDTHLTPSKNKFLEQGSECLVCVKLVDVNMFGLSCGHLFCSDCWYDYIRIKIDQGLSFGIECMLCDVFITMEMIESLLKPLAMLYAKYLRLVLTEFVQSHHLLRWCPGKDCNMIFHVQEIQAKRVQCTSCNTKSCFKCGEDYHCPTDCETFKRWLVKCEDDSETANYIQANTKDCPNCHTAIEKNGGCNHIYCVKCKHDFCWMCMENWSKHNGEYYECSRYKANPTEYDERASDARSALKKYLFYYHRWQNHHQSLLLEEQTRLKIQSHIETKVGDGEGTWIDWQYLLDGADLLRRCRYTLKYTYPRAYWMEGDKKQLFEYQQAQLELEIENLSWKVERANITDRADLERQMTVTEIRRVTLLRDFTL